MNNQTDNTVPPEHARPKDGLLISFLTQMAANAAGTIIGGAILGGVAIRFGLLSPSPWVLYELQDLAWVLGLATPAVAAFAMIITRLFNWLEPKRRDRRRLILVTALQIIFSVGAAVAVLGHIAWQLTGYSFNWRGFLAFLCVEVVFVAAVFGVRAFARGQGILK